jgi:D-alanyl-lipoteichoic acid acyltransferase DltB (MBOAT superfamily)
MEIVSLNAAAFVVAALLVHHILPQRARLAGLLAASYVFHCLVAWQFAPVLLGFTVVNHAIAARLNGPSGRAWLWAGVALNVAALGVLRSVYRTAPFAEPFAVVGLSFYSLQAVSYLVDLRAGKVKRCGLAEVAVYLGYFPKLVAGPIERAGVFLAQLRQPRVVDDETVARAGTLIASGLTRKLLIADPLRAALPQKAFSSPEEIGAVPLAAAIVGFAFALYNDFAGYTHLARGVSALFGIELSPNFARPFASTSFTEFWNRWHITLSHWLRDYIYLPLSRALLRRDPSLWNVPNLILPPMATMLASGLWHGASAHMLLWGGMHGFYLVVERVLGLLRPRRAGSKRAAWRRAAAIVVVFVLGSWAFVPFRVDVETALVYWRGLLGPAGTLRDVRIPFFLLLSLWLDRIEGRHGDDRAFWRWPRPVRAALLAAAALLWFLATRQEPPAPFIYRGF